MKEEFDGVWACASLLHVPRSSLDKSFSALLESLKPNGVFYLSFKYGEREEDRSGRHFTHFTEETFYTFIEPYKGVSILKTWKTSDSRPNRESEKWLNVLIYDAPF